MDGTEFEYPGPKGRAYHAIGAFIVQTSMFDRLLGALLLFMITPNDDAHTAAMPLVAGADFHVKLAMIRSLAALHKAPRAAEMDEACDILREVYDRRNQLVHSVASEGAKADEVCLVEITFDKDGEKYTIIHVKPKDIQGWLSKGLKAMTNLYNAASASGYAKVKPKPNPDATLVPEAWKRELAVSLRSHRSSTPRFPQPEARQDTQAA